jgi:hypothetical protein
MDKHVQKGIYPVLVGGLGNQMFILSAGYMASQCAKCPLYLSKKQKADNPHNIHKIDYYKTIFRSFGTHIDKEEESLIHELNARGYHRNNQKGFSVYNPHHFGPGTIMESYYQYYPPIEEFESELRQKFLEGISEFREEVKGIYNFEKAAFLHIRRGDYLRNPYYHFIQGIEYYEKAVQMLREKQEIQKIYIFSDDIPWVKSQSFFQNDIFEIIEESHELKTLAIMTLCTEGAICGNSTFSWWGAFLGTHEKRNTVIVPKGWINDNVVCLFPSSWIII